MRNQAGTTGQGSDWEIVTCIDQVESVAPEVDGLLASVGAPASAYWSSTAVWFRLHPAFAPWGLLLRRDRVLVGAVLLAHAMRTGVQRLTTAGQVSEPGWPAATDPFAAAELAVAMHHALDAFGDPWLLHLSDLREDNPVIEALQREFALARVTPGAPVPRLHFTAGSPLAHYLSRNTREAASRARKRVRAAGLRLELAWLRSARAIEACLPEVLDVHRRRNRQLRGVAGLDDPGEAELFVETIRAHAVARRARLLTLRLADGLAAFDVCFESGGALWVYSNMASPDWLAFSPGTIANAEVVEAAHADPLIRCIDWGAGIQRYKLSGDVTVGRLQDFQAWSSRTNWLAWKTVQAARRVWQRTGASPRV